MPPKAGARRTANASASGENQSQQNTPDTNPAPTQSATPGPSGRPVQRLQSLKKRPASSSIAPGARPSSTPGGEAPKPALKFKPKAVVRKSKEEREAIEKLEAERNNERLKEAAAIQRGRGGARGRGATRGRGGAVGVAVSGPLGSGAGLSFGGAKRGRGGGVGGGGPGGGYGGRRGAAQGGLGGGNRFDDSSDDELRVSIDNINLSSDEDDDDMVDIKGKKPTRRRVPTNNGMRPWRVPRREHEERTISVNMESSSSKAAEIREKAHAEAGAIEVLGDVTGPTEAELLQTPVKKERDDEDTAMEDLPQDDDFLPATPVSVRRKTSESKNVKDKEPAIAPPHQVPRSLLRTKEENEEHDRHLEDLEHFRNLLSIRVTEKPQKPAEEESESTENAPEPATKEPEPEPMETEAEGETEESAADKEQEKEDSEPKINEHLLGQLFLMQFPPMTPTLAVPSEAPAEPEPQPPQAPETEIKPEDDDLQITGGLPARKEATNVITATTPWSLPAGRVGKMNVHKSGRVTMDWGGVSFELDRAAHVDFAQEALIMSTPEAVESGQPARDTARQTAWSMGQLSGKFTVMPNWDHIL